MWVCYYSVDKTHFRQENCSRRFHLETCFKANYYYCILCVAIPKDKGNSTSAPRNHWLPQNFAPQTSGKVGTVKQGTWRFRMSIWKGNFMAFCFCSTFHATFGESPHSAIGLFLLGRSFSVLQTFKLSKSLICWPVSGVAHKLTLVASRSKLLPKLNITILGTENQKTVHPIKCTFPQKYILFLNFKYMSGTWKISILTPRVDLQTSCGFNPTKLQTSGAPGSGVPPLVKRWLRTKHQYVDSLLPRKKRNSCL